MKNIIKLSFDKYSIFQFIKKETLVTFQDIVDYICLDRDNIIVILESLIEKEIVCKFDYNLNLVKGETEEEELIRAIKGGLYNIKQNKRLPANLTGDDYDNFLYEIKNELLIEYNYNAKVKKIFFWRIRFFIKKLFRKILKTIPVKKDMIDMYRKNKQRIKNMGLKKEKAEQKHWAKKILKSRNKQKIIKEIKDKGFFKDKAKVIWTKISLGEIVYKGIFIVAKKGNWAIEINSNIPNYERYEFLSVYTPFDSYFFVRIKK